MTKQFTGPALALGFALALPPVAGQAQTPARSDLIQGLSGCRQIAENAARLACYDAAASRLDSAEQSGEVVVVNREQVRAARRQAFGFNLPSLDMFRRGAAEPELDRLSLVVAGAFQGGDGKWVFRTEGGQTWRQTDTARLSPRPRAGSKLEVRRAAMGSYLANVDGQTAVRVRREQ